MKSNTKISITIVTVILLILSSSNWNNSSAVSLENGITNTNSIEMISDASIAQNFTCGFDSQSDLALRDCTVTLKGENYELEVTFYDVSWWTCTKLKIGTWWNNTF